MVPNMISASKLLRSIVLGTSALVISCAQNPVTKQSELHLVSQNKEVAIGSEHYPLAQQMSGGKYSIDPELTSYVQSVGQRLAKVSERNTLPFEFVVLNDSTPNAWALPGGKISINRGLLIHLQSEAELAAVLGHEITHATARHGAKSMERQIAWTAGLGLMQAILIAKSDDETTQKVGMAGAAATIGLMTQKYGRDAEREADHYGIDTMVKAGYDPKAAVQLQETFVRLMDNKSAGWLEGLFSSHPPSQERAQANFVYSQTFPQTNLTMGKEVYQQKIALLKKRQPAYDAYDEGRKKLDKKDYTGALSFAEKAITIEPKEALFYALKADVYAAQNNPTEAVKWYTQAIDRDKGYFYYYLQRGLSYEKLKQHEASKQDLKQSQTLLPTEVAQSALSRMK